jgi:hypothetical protein
LDRWNECQSQLSLGKKEHNAAVDIKDLFKELNLKL